MSDPKSSLSVNGEITTLRPSGTDRSLTSYKYAVRSSGIEGLDVILGGGIPSGSLVLLVGAPGTGKTTLVHQICFNWISLKSPDPQADLISSTSELSVGIQNAPAAPTQTEADTIKSSKRASHAPKSKPKTMALYFSTLSEPHDKVLAHMQQFDFFDPSQLDRNIKLLSLSSIIEQGAAAVATFIVRTARQERAELVALDGLGALLDSFSKPAENRLFLYQLSAQLNVLGVTCLITLEQALNRVAGGADFATVADGIISLTNRLEGMAEYQQTQIVKLRGMKRLEGLHAYRITPAGLAFYPRLEALVKTDGPTWSSFLTAAASDTVTSKLARSAKENEVAGVSSTSTGANAAVTKPNTKSQIEELPALLKRRLGFGLVQLDQMLSGGVSVGSTTLAVGSAGVGKTLLGLNYLAQGAKADEAGLYIGFYEPIEQLQAKDQDFHLGLIQSVEAGRLVLQVVSSVELEVDELVAQIRQVLQTQLEGGQPIRRMVIDGIEELEQLCRSQNRSRTFLIALVKYVREQGISLYCTYTTSKLVGAELDLSQSAFGVLAENLLLIRQIEYRGRYHRILSILKMRDSAYDPYLREFTIRAGQGIEVLEKFQSEAGILTGITQQLSESEHEKGNLAQAKFKAKTAEKGSSERL